MPAHVGGFQQHQQPNVVVPPRCGEVVAPYLQALNVNSHAMMNIFEAMCASMDVLEGRIMQANAQLSSRVEDLESSFKNLAHNVQGYAEPIRHPTTPGNRRRGPHNRAMVIGDEASERALERMHELQQEADFLDMRSTPGSSPLSRASSSVHQQRGGGGYYFPASPMSNGGGGGDHEPPPQALHIQEPSTLTEPSLDGYGYGNELLASPSSSGKKARVQGPEPEYKKREPPKTPRSRWKWALHEVKMRRQVGKMSLLHSRAPSKLNLRDRLFKNEEKMEHLGYQVDRFYEAFVELVIKDKKQEQIDALKVEIHTLQDTAHTLESRLAEQERTLQEQSSELKAAMAEARDMCARQEADLSAFKKYTIATLEMQHETGKKLQEMFHSLASMSLQSLLTEVEGRLEDALEEDKAEHRGEEEEEEGGRSELVGSLTTLRDNLRKAISIATDQAAIEGGMVKEMASCLLKNIEEVMEKVRHAKIKIDPALLQRLGDAELQLHDLAVAQQLTEGQVSRLGTMMSELNVKMEDLKVDSDNIKFDLARKVEFKQHEEDLDGKADKSTLLDLKDEHAGLARKVEEQAHDVFVKVSEELDQRMGLLKGNNQKPADQQSLEQIADLAREVNRALQDYDLLRQEVGSKAATQEVTSALQAVDSKLQQLELGSLQRDEMEDWLGKKADRKELQELAMRLSMSSGAEYEDSMSFIIARKRIQPVLRCLSCDHPLPLNKKPHKHLLDDDQKQQQQRDWQMLGQGGFEQLAKISVYRDGGKTQDDIHVGGHSSNNNNMYELDPLMLQDGQLLSRYPRMMPPPNRVRTAVGGGGLGLSVRGRLKEKLEHKKREDLLMQQQQQQHEARHSPSRPAAAKPASAPGL